MWDTPFDSDKVIINEDDNTSPCYLSLLWWESDGVTCFSHWTSVALPPRCLRCTFNESSSVGVGGYRQSPCLHGWSALEVAIVLPLHPNLVPPWSPRGNAPGWLNEPHHSGKRAPGSHTTWLHFWKVWLCLTANLSVSLDFIISKMRILIPIIWGCQYIK